MKILRLKQQFYLNKTLFKILLVILLVELVQILILDDLAISSF